MESLSLKRMSLGALLLVGCFGCGGQQLEGSLSTVLELHYARSNASSSADEMVVRFIQPLGDGENIVLAVSASRAGVDPTALQFNLAETMPLGNQRGAITRNVFNDPRTTFPPLSYGHLTFNSSLIVGQTVGGNFSATFAPGTTFASGRTVFGSFGATVQ
jgi:hypothetical protein